MLNDVAILNDNGHSQEALELHGRVKWIHDKWVNVYTLLRTKLKRESSELETAVINVIDSEDEEIETGESEVINILDPDEEANIETEIETVEIQSGESEVINILDPDEGTDSGTETETETGDTGTKIETIATETETEAIEIDNETVDAGGSRPPIPSQSSKVKDLKARSQGRRQRVKRRRQCQTFYDIIITTADIQNAPATKAGWNRVLEKARKNQRKQPKRKVVDNDKDEEPKAKASKWSPSYHQKEKGTTKSDK